MIEQQINIPNGDGCTTTFTTHQGLAFPKTPARHWEHLLTLYRRNLSVTR
jgi:hypothetical protein